MPKVSVLIPSYNHARFLAATLESVSAQTFTDYEVVVVDDGSTDDSVEILRGYGDRIRLLTQHNRGTYPTLNRCIAEATGRLLAILNSDDMWAPSKLQRQVEVLESNSRIGLVHTGGNFMDDKGEIQPGNPLGFEWPRTAAGNIIEALVRYNKIIASSVLTRRECFERLGFFDERLFGSGDWEMWLRIAMHYDIAYVDEPLTFYRVHESNTSLQQLRIHQDDILIREERIHAHEPELWRRANSRWKMRLALAHSYACLGTERALLGNRSRATRAYLESLRLCPWRFKSVLRLFWTLAPRPRKAAPARDSLL